MWEAIAVGVIVVAAAAWVGRRLWRAARGRGGCADCDRRCADFPEKVDGIDAKIDDKE